MPLNIDELKARAAEYVKMEGKTEVLSVDFEESFTLFGMEDVVLSVKTTEVDDPEWWVICGSTPMNLYTKNKFPSADEAFSFHTGIMHRLHDRDFKASDTPPDDVGYDAFISHASEDKESFVRELAEELKQMGFLVWYDEFTLEVGDSLRRAINKGLANSRYGIVVLSPSFLEKNWPQYELDGLTAREMQGTKVILPVWHRITQQDILRYSPSLADKLAANSNEGVKAVARKLARVLEKV
ncbi:toll/interleukin-1 receptor domain-containing protein [Desulfocurvus sp. DL9XJH121]